MDEDISSARNKLDEALKALRIANKLRVENVQFNNYRLNTPSESIGGRLQQSSAPLMDYLDSTKNESLINLRRLRSTDDSEGTKRIPKYGYSLSPDIIQAAKEVAEFQPPTTSDVDYAAIARKARAKYSLGNNDTNYMAQKLIGPDGLSEYVLFEQGSGSHQQPLQAAIPKAATSPYWMAQVEQNGASPFAPPGYKVYFDTPILNFT